MYKACIFDLDGTLTNTLDSLTYSTNKTLWRKTSRKILLDFVNSFPTAAVPLCLRSALHKK